jgi:hypothetical protein
MRQLSLGLDQHRFVRASGRPLIKLPKPGAGARFIEKVSVLGRTNLVAACG